MQPKPNSALSTLLLKKKNHSKARKSKQVKKDNLNKCTGCGGTELQKDSMVGELTCVNCGLVLKSRMISDEKEWREFEGDEKSKRRVRVGGPVDELLGNMSTSIGKGSKNGAHLSRVQKETALTSEEKLLQKGYDMIENISKKLQLFTSFRRHAKEMFKDLVKSGFLKGKNRNIWVSACIYVSCEVGNKPRNLQSVANAAQIGVKQLARKTKELKKELKIVTTRKTPQFYINEFFARVNMSSSSVETLALHIYNQATDLSIFGGKTPTTIAASIFYFVLRLHNLLNGINIEEVTGVKLETIESTIPILEAHKESILPKTIPSHMVPPVEQNIGQAIPAPISIFVKPKQPEKPKKKYSFDIPQ